MIGALLAWSMSAQRALLSNVPINFAFPWTLVYIVLGCAVFSAVFATGGPLYRMVAGKTVVSQLRDG